MAPQIPPVAVERTLADRDVFDRACHLELAAAERAVASPDGRQLAPPLTSRPLTTPEVARRDDWEESVAPANARPMPVASPRSGWPLPLWSVLAIAGISASGRWRRHWYCDDSRIAVVSSVCDLLPSVRRCRAPA
ncbi:MAG: hypothetical protein HC838_04950, partial [Spirulinaceae cyanobacterium RM2_2_10]|nr:hypothetical protein [Spirulinaceae cyanobacterium RM2_2_10]